MTKIIHCFSP